MIAKETCAFKLLAGVCVMFSQSLLLILTVTELSAIASPEFRILDRPSSENKVFDTSQLNRESFREDYVNRCERIYGQIDCADERIKNTFRKPVRYPLKAQTSP